MSISTRRLSRQQKRRTLSATVVDNGSGTATLNWVANYTPAQWNVSRDETDSDGSGPWSTALNGQARSQTFTFLTAGQTYHLTVSDGILSATCTIIPGSATPPANTISGFSVASVTASSITLSWSYNGAALNDYTLVRDGSTIATLSNSSTTYTDSGLTTGSSHSYQLAGNLSAGGTTNTASATATVGSAATSGAWLSGASGDGVADGSFANWRGEPLGIIGTWQFNPSDTFDPGREFGNWYGNVDLGYGGYIYRSMYGDDYTSAANGSADSRWTNTLTYINNRWQGKGTIVYMRLAYEFNGEWMSNWNVNAGQEQDFINCWRRFRGLQQQIAPNTVKLVWCPTNNHNTQLTLSCWPGAQYVDVVGIDTYNEWPWRNDQASLDAYLIEGSPTAPIGPEMWRQWAAAQGLPLGIGEWSNNADLYNKDTNQGGGGDSPLFFQTMHNWMSSNAGTGAGKLLYEVQFNVQSQNNGRFAIYPASKMPQNRLPCTHH